jgi:hypothetical protein
MPCPNAGYENARVNLLPGPHAHDNVLTGCGTNYKTDITERAGTGVRRRSGLFLGTIIVFAIALILPMATSAGASTGMTHVSVVKEITSVAIPNVTITCTQQTGIGGGSSNLTGYAYFSACTGIPSECSSTAEMQEEPVGTTTWSTIKDGGIAFGCPPNSGISYVNLSCHSTPHNFNYRTRAIYVMIAGGKTATRVSYSPVRTLYAACS